MNGPDFHAASQPIYRVMNPPANDPLAPAPPARSPADLATAERFLAVLRAGGDARGTKVRRLRRSVRTDTYENDLKLSVAVDRVVRELGH